MNKSHFLKHCRSFIKSKLQSVEEELNGLQQALTSETKSSAGDKHETGRAMLHLEIEKLGKQYDQLKRQLRSIESINITDKSGIIKEGSLIRTDKGWFLLGIALGKVSYDNKQVFCLSIASPMGTMLNGRKQGDVLNWQNDKLRIENVFQ